MMMCEKKQFYATIKSYFIMLQSNTRSEYEYCIATRAALDPEDDDERYELTHRADRCFADMLRYERALMYIEELQDKEEQIK